MFRCCKRGTIMQSKLTRRAVLTAIAALPGTQLAFATERRSITVSKDANCGCCNLWIAHLEQNGFACSSVNVKDLRSIKARLGVPHALSSCHTAEIEGYVIEGHVPAHAVQRLLRERPQVRGLAVPGMPIGSPGMEGGTPEFYDVIQFSGAETAVFGRYRGALPS